MRKQRVLIPCSLKAIMIPHHLFGITGGGATPRDEGPQTEIGRTSKGGSSTLPEEPPASTTGEGGEEAPTFRILPRTGGQPSGELGGFRFTLLFFFASTSKLDRSSPHVGFVIRGSETEGEEDLGTKGFMTERGEDLRNGSRAGLAPHEPGISYLMSLE